MDRGKRTAIVAAVLVLIVVFAIGAALILTSGAPKEDLSRFPSLQLYVNDNAQVLTYDDYYDLDNFCYEVELNNSCQIAVLTINTTQPVGINDFALKVFEKNGIGQQGKDNGVLVVVSINEKAWRVVTGRGVSDILSGATLTRLSQEMNFEQHLTEGNYSEGIKLFVYDIGLTLIDNYISPGHDPWQDYPIPFLPLNWWQLGLVLGGVLVLTVVTRGRFLGIILWALFRGRGGGGGSWGGGRTGGGGARGRY